MSAGDGLAAQGRRDLIVEKAAELFARKTISATTVREISDAAGILSGSLYHYFESKDAIIDVVMSTYLDDLLGRYSAAMAQTDDVKELFQALVVASLRTVEAHPSATMIYQHDAHYFRQTARFRYVRVAAEQVRQTWMTALEAGVNEGVFRSDMPTRYLYVLLRDGLWLTVRWFRPSAAYGVDELAADMCRLYYQAFASTDTLREMLARRTDDARRPHVVTPSSAAATSAIGHRRKR